MTNNTPHSSHLPHADVGAFLRRHNKMLSFVGALIIFITFVVKEGLREHLKDLVDALGSAQSIFRIRYENAEMLGLLERLVVANVTGRNNGDADTSPCESKSGVFYGSPYGLGAMYGGYGNGGYGGGPGYPYSLGTTYGGYGNGGYGGGPGYPYSLGTTYGSGYFPGSYGVTNPATTATAGAGVSGPKFYINADQLVAVDSVLEDLDHLIKELPNQSDKAQRLEGFAKESIAYHQKYSKSKDECRTEPNETDKMTTALSAQVNKYAFELLTNTESLRAKAARRYEVCTWASYILYTLGWALGLVGRLYGGLEIAGDE